MERRRIRVHDPVWFMIYDTAIVGTGPAGVSAALTLKIRDKSFIWIGDPNLSSKVVKAEMIQNYPGLKNATGKELNEAFKSQIEDMGIEIEDRMVNSIMPFGDHFALTAGDAFYEAKTIILATGVVFKAALRGESELTGMGVSYCATCDGRLYKGKKIAVICGTERFEGEVQFLADLAEELHLFAGYKGVGADLTGRENVVVHDDRITGINGSGRVESIETTSGTIPVDGVFILRDSISMSSLLPGLELSDGHISVDRTQKTSVPGVFAAGDCTGRPYQYTKAVGEGNVAAHSVLEYIDK